LTLLRICCGFGFKYLVWRTNLAPLYNLIFLDYPFRGEFVGLVNGLFVDAVFNKICLGHMAQTLFSSADRALLFTHLQAMKATKVTKRSSH
jgi:hypothetical protein